MGRVFTDAQFHYRGRLAIALVDQELINSCGASDADLEGVIGHLRNVAGVEAAFLIRELPGQDLQSISEAVKHSMRRNLPACLAAAVILEPPACN